MNPLTKKLAYSGIAITLAAVATYFHLPPLPMGGCITFFSMFFISLVGYWFGIRWGLAAGIAYGLLQFLFNPYILSPPQFVCDYILAFAGFGLSGLANMEPLKNSRLRLQIGYLIGVLLRWVFSVISGVIFFGSYAAEAGFDSPLLYSMAYNASYIFTEAVLTLIVISIPAVSKAINRLTLSLQSPAEQCIQ